MSKHQIAIYSAEREAGLAETIRANASVAYLVEVEPVGTDNKFSDELRAAFASDHSAENFDLYYMKDVLATTGWNKNRDVFDRVEAWVARHTPEDKPFNFEHRPLDIIGHVIASHVVDEKFNEIADDTSVDHLPNKFHIINGSVLYLHSPDEARENLMKQTVAEIAKGEWFVSMECLFRGFDYGVIRPDGSQHIIPRSEATAFLTKHLAQYGGQGSYKCEETGQEFSLGRVLRNITFSGKGLVRKPANPESIILNSVATFIPTDDTSGYLSIGTNNSTSITENHLMAEANVTDQALRDLNARLEQQVSTLQTEIAGLKNKDTEVALANLRKDVTERDGVIAERDKTIAGLQAQLATITESSKSLEKKVQDAEGELVKANESLKSIQASETKRARESMLREKHAPENAIADLVEKLSILDDGAFASTIDTIASSWKKPEVPKTKADPVVAAVQNATVDQEEATLTTASEDTRETSRAAIVDFMGKSMRDARGGRPSIYANTNGDA